MESKKDIRKNVLEKRSNLTAKEWEEKSRNIYKKVVSHPFFLSADTIYCYIDYRNEAGTRDIIKKAWEWKKKLAVPKVEGTEMSFYFIREFSDLKEGYRGIPEPEPIFPAEEENAPDQTSSVLVIVPGAAFDKNCNRIGYGKGYYDKFLSSHKNCHTMAICFECQMVDEIPAESYDIRPEIVITEENIYVK